MCAEVAKLSFSLLDEKEMVFYRMEIEDIMETERLKIFDETMQYIGEKTREEVHTHGYWHETFHCWLTTEIDNILYLLFQKRASVKKDFPNLLDITSAGHLLATESVEDGTREIQEELGLAIDYKDLIPLGTIKEEIKMADFWDREFCHVFLYQLNSIPSFYLQEEEVSGIYLLKVDGILPLVQREIDQTIGYQMNQSIQLTKEIITSDQLAPHSLDYYLKVIPMIKEG